MSEKVLFLTFHDMNCTTKDVKLKYQYFEFCFNNSQYSSKYSLKRMNLLSPTIYALIVFTLLVAKKLNKILLEYKTII